MCEENGSFIRILAATGLEHVLRVNNELTYNDVISALKRKLHFNCPLKSLAIVATRLSNRMTLPAALLVKSIIHSSTLAQEQLFPIFYYPTIVYHMGLHIQWVVNW